MMKIEHIGIAVNDLDASNQVFEKLLGRAAYKQEIVEGEKVKVSFFQSGDLKVELLQATDEESPIARFLRQQKEGIHHLAFAVENIREEVKRLKAEGFTFLNEAAKDGADNKLIVFLHPKSTNGVLVELCQDKNAYG
ncbi:methylmalonyl-CoA epimerase [Cyclobacterium plantarum]|uniref:Methylmalonyl-CoA epimerase n=1 Tax=Cyclobacterium plantarum TaxID=2716263 RepID=A0ABX0HHK3_9BACT|nr:methylmalonyl-CoA epimerase [Cyclobacterium plantarum]NHE59793.1 methylmalonyl-CoA epimerase [Cyclobacterium plantarum]